MCSFITLVSMVALNDSFGSQTANVQLNETTINQLTTKLI